MEMEYRDPSRRGKFIVILGVVLALAAGGAAFFLINQAQQQAGQSGLKTVRSPSTRRTPKQSSSSSPMR
jgi:flagellar basal body-associated protein FliL